jgi:ligand-binding sensor domain-containing protein/DNA-binding response OmpR family regulator/nitrogen-specific signal transduction histidine kinase
LVYFHINLKIMQANINHRFLLATILFLLTLLPVNSANNIFRHYDTSDGLSQNSVMCIVQDKMGFMWFGTRNGLNRFDGRSFKVYRHGDMPYSLGNDHINVLYEGPDDELWIGTSQGVYIYTPRDDTFRHFNVRTAEGKTVSGDINVITGNSQYIYIASTTYGVYVYDIHNKKLTFKPTNGGPSIFSMAVDKSGTLWVGYYRSGLNYTRDNFLTTHSVYTDSGKQVLEGQTISSIATSDDGKLWLCTMESGLNVYNTNTRQAASIFSSYKGRSLYAHSLLKAGNEIIMATETALVVYDITNHTTQCYEYEPTDPFSLSDVHLQVAYMDRDGGLWIGSYFGGINYSPHTNNVFTNFFPRVDIPTSLFGRRVHQLEEDVQGRIWIGTEDGGLGWFDPSSNLFHHLDLPGLSANVQSMNLIDGMLWVGTFQDGVTIINPRTGKIVKRLTAPGDGLNDANIFTTEHLHDGKVAIGTFGGLNIWNPSTHQMISVESIPKKIIYAILEDHQHNLWVAVYNDAIYMLPANGKTWKRFVGKGQKVDNTVCLFEDSRGGIWATTDGNGVSRYNTRTKRFDVMDISHYRPRQVVVSINEDHKGRLWMGTNDGLICYDPGNQSTRLFTTTNGLLDNNFSYSSALCSRTGKMYFGSQSGLTSFMPETFLGSNASHNIRGTELIINGQTVDNLSEDSPLKHSITATRSIVLNHNQNSFALKMSVLSYREAQNEELVYMLKGFDKDWQHLYNYYYIRYTNLPPGHYQLLVKDTNGNNKDVYTLDITIRQPWWNTWWAWILWLSISCTSIYFIYRYLTQRSDMLRRIAIRKFEFEKEKDLYRSKINFFTNVAHEIRTPLTLIKGPLTDIIGRKNYDRATESDLSIMDKNVSRLLDLTNQLLDFRKTEMDGLKLNIEHSDINQLINDVYVRFTSLMDKRGISHRLIMPKEPFWAYVDRESFTKIISNLTNNAVKYCDKQMSVTLEPDTDDKSFLVKISNDGHVIEPSIREKLFKPFFRIESATKVSTTGTGIGLALARTLAELHGGSLKMDDRADLNVFVLQLPIGSNPTLNLEEQRLDATEELEQPTGTEDTDNIDADAKKKYTLLVVEDNADMLRYEKSHLQQKWTVLTADNGQEASEILKQYDIDLIVSDAMMEPIDGFELCKMVKEDVNFSHIPFILLTALTIDSAKVKGMESGADYYIEKPFSMDYLMSVIENLLRTRKEIKQAYAASPFTDRKTVTISKADEEFTRKLEKAVADNLTDSDFGITELADIMCMSRTNLNRKIKGIFDLTPNNYIKVERLKKAAQLMKEDDVKVNEVCFRVGFSSPSYFTQCFQKQFGLLPKDFIMRG